MNKLTIEELPNKIDEILEEYGNGDDTHYHVETDNGDVVLVPYDGPYTELIQETPEGEAFINIPKRLCSKLGLTEDSTVEVETKDGSIILKP